VTVRSRVGASVNLVGENRIIGDSLFDEPVND